MEKIFQSHKVLIWIKRNSYISLDYSRVEIAAAARPQPMKL